MQENVDKYLVSEFETAKKLKKSLSTLLVGLHKDLDDKSERAQRNEMSALFSGQKESNKIEEEEDNNDDDDDDDDDDNDDDDDDDDKSDSDSDDYDDSDSEDKGDSDMDDKNGYGFSDLT